ncbi:hypothetical protein M3T53_03845 [Actinomyces sp. B33]|uniref:hypothetical protein n=1 Tax=Actinomyces sp. B33 TaxID=2942131 RepID=UPI00233F8D7A|nr:hypothetical protein [Actinomyces sp. B33]MDC4232845.1 hypothetical protein [Actinomyces sp. B33]
MKNKKAKWLVVMIAGAGTACWALGVVLAQSIPYGRLATSIGTLLMGIALIGFLVGTTRSQ